jgi:hypothetical protein
LRARHPWARPSPRQQRLWPLQSACPAVWRAGLEPLKWLKERAFLIPSYPDHCRSTREFPLCLGASAVLDAKTRPRHAPLSHPSDKWTEHRHSSSIGSLSFNRRRTPSRSRLPYSPHGRLNAIQQTTYLHKTILLGKLWEFNRR